MPLTSRIQPHSSQWPSLYEQEAARLVPVWGAALSEIHHIGSTAVPGLSAKPEIDILVVIAANGLVETIMRPLQQLGYRRGRDLSPGHHFFKRDDEGVRTHKLHVCIGGHSKIQEFLKFRDFLRQNEDARRSYEDLKRRLERENTRGIAEYLDGKAPFIQGMVEKL